MHDAYEAVPILERLPLVIECIACWGENPKVIISNTNSVVHKNNKNSTINLLVGTKQGHLLVYKLEGGSGHAEVTLEKSNKSFSKKPLQQLYVSPEYKIVISLSDGIVSVHDLTTYQLITCVQKSKGASFFSADLEEQISSMGDVAHALKLCVSVKRKLQFYFWKKRDFVELHNDICLAELPRTIAWCKDSLCIGFKREYYLVKLDGDEDLKELYPTGKLLEPVIGNLGNDQVILMIDDRSVFVDSNGEPTYKHPFAWSDIPVIVESQPPYLIAVLPKYVEVRTMEPKLLIQSIDINKPKMLCSWGDCIFVASNTHVWAIQQLPVSSQIDKLIKDREFELALKLANILIMQKMSDTEDEQEKNKSIQHINTLLAFELFCQKRFDESLHNFTNLKTDPSQVIGLYPDLLPGDYRQNLKYPSAIPAMAGPELEKAMLSLIEYLTQKRNETMAISGSIVDLYPIVEGNVTVRSKRQLLQIIDTTLLKCYIKTNDALIAPLLRLPDNNCHVEEAERILKKAHKQRELIELYRKKGLHRKALNLLLHQSQTQQNKEEVREDMIEYLQHIGQTNIDLIFDFAPGLLKIDPMQAMKIFTEDTAEVESLSKNQVLDFLDSISINLAVAYLEHVIHTWNDETPEFHNRLLLAYKDRVLALTKEHHDSLAEEDQTTLQRGPVELTETRNKLLFFLETSQQYQAERILPEFPPDRLLEERAVLLGRMGNYEQALALYAHSLKDPIRAENFCQLVYNQNPSKNSDVFLCLLRMYLQPESLHRDTDAPFLPEDQPRSINLHAALRVMHQHANKLNPEKGFLNFLGHAPLDGT
ncbi:unnamed protein product [Clavelina lepadiformis]|uniref:CNH domain-containing protein n=1 Tax=Clavelina lepadiformis TaxID=159417 RepID=A0ABP0GTS5_CLALP